MAKINVSLKHVQISKDNSIIIGVVSLAAFALVMTGFVANALIAQRSYQARVISQKEAAKDQLEANIDAAESLRRSYQSFVATDQNIIGGFSDGDGERDGDNARIVLDALPSSYDFPALITSIEKVLSDQNVNIVSISGRDEQLTQADLTGDEPVEIPFSVEFSTSYNGAQRVISAFERSIRPFHIERAELRGDDDQLRVSLQLKTYFQPETKFEVEERTVQ